MTEKGDIILSSSGGEGDKCSKMGQVVALQSQVPFQATILAVNVTDIGSLIERIVDALLTFCKERICFLTESNETWWSLGFGWINAEYGRSWIEKELLSKTFNDLGAGGQRLWPVGIGGMFGLMMGGDG